MKRLILGKGKVSHIISNENDIVFNRKQCDITNIEKVYQAVLDSHADIVINCAAKTSLEYCQLNKVAAFNSNVLGAVNVLSVCKDLNKKFIHISSGCLFDGNSEESTEESKTSPAVWYTWTKKWADEIIQNFEYDNFLILRPRQLISSVPHPSNMLTKFANMEKINAIEEMNSLTCIEDLSLMIDHLVKKDLTGIFNCSNVGFLSPYDIAIGVKNTINQNLKVEKISYSKLLNKLPNKRVNTLLSCDKLINSGFEPRSAADALSWCLENYGNQEV